MKRTAAQTSVAQMIATFDAKKDREIRQNFKPLTREQIARVPVKPKVRQR
jgi:hypothetical protein